MQFETLIELQYEVFSQLKASTTYVLCAWETAEYMHIFVRS